MTPHRPPRATADPGEVAEGATTRAHERLSPHWRLADLAGEADLLEPLIERVQKERVMTLTLAQLTLAPLKFPHDNRRGLVLRVGKLKVALYLWLKFWTWPSITYYRRREDTGGHNLRVGPVMIAWKWRKS
jgi:hypothetical protein